MSEAGRGGQQEEVMEDEAAGAAVVLEDRQPAGGADATGVGRRGSNPAAAVSRRQQVGGEPVKRHDLAPIHSMLLDLAISLQLKVNLEIQNIGRIRRRLSLEMNQVAGALDGIGEVSLPEGLSLPTSSLSPTSQHFDALSAICSIHSYRDHAALLLREKAAKFWEAPRQPPTLPEPADFNAASDEMDISFHYLRTLLDEIGACARELQTNEGDEITLRKFSSGMLKEIDSLEKQYVMEKMGELSLRSCSIQSRKPVRSIGHTLDLQEIMMLAKNAKSMVYEVSLKMLKLVDTIKGEEIYFTAIYHALTKENSELLRRYCLYLKLKIQQL